MANNYGAGVRLDTHELDRMAAGLKTNTQRIAAAFALKMEGRMKQNAAVDTGAMRASVYTVTRESNGLSAVQSEVKSLNPDAVLTPIPAPSGFVAARVGPSVEYAMLVEYGTSRSAAQPFVIPTAEAMSAEFNSGRTWKELFE